MKRVLRDHGDIIHWTGGRGFFPVKTSSGNLEFARHGQLEGRTPIGWQDFFPPFDRGGFVVVLDEENESVEVVSEQEAQSQLGEAAQNKGRVPHQVNPEAESEA